MSDMTFTKPPREFSISESFSFGVHAWVTRSLKRLESLKYSIFSPPSKPPCFKFCQIVFRSCLNTTVKFFERESWLSKSRNLLAVHLMAQCMWMLDQIQSDWVDPLSQKFTEAFTYFFQSSLWNLGLRDTFLNLWIYKHWFLRLQTWQLWCETLQNLIRNPANSDVTLSDIYFNLLEFWTPRHFYTSLKNEKEKISFSWLKILQAV